MQSYSHCDDVQWLAVGQPGHTWVWVLQSSKVVMFIHSFDDNSGVCDFTESHLTGENCDERQAPSCLSVIISESHSKAQLTFRY